MEQRIAIQICLGSSCFSRGNRDTLEVIKRYIDQHNLHDSISFKGKLCSNQCSEGPTLTIDGIVHKRVTSDEAISLIEQSLKSN